MANSCCWVAERAIGSTVAVSISRVSIFHRCNIFSPEKLMKNARKLLAHKTAGPVVETAYNDHANAKQRLAFSQQFYGPEFMLPSSDEQQPLSKAGL